ncbi:MAG: molybdopterin molybdenumtransferase MoeA [Rhodospirillaceae bacterium]|nr:molybdopterin molybdenumtransferase MoeA [Rhodospirillaceae bacterium]
MSTLLPVTEALRLIVEDLEPVAAETVVLVEALGRTLRADALAQVSHPPADVSAMDGYAVRCDDISKVPCKLRVIGESAAGHPWRESLSAGDTVRIFTGAYVPEGADGIVIQEDTAADEARVSINQAPQRGRHIRRCGQDFRKGEAVLAAPRRLTARDIGLLAAMNLPSVTVACRPRVGVLSTGDEIVMPGDPVADGQIVSANGPGLCAFISAHGGEPLHLGVVTDDPKALLRLVEQSRFLDLLVTTGGVSVGDHDIVKEALSGADFKAAFHKIAMRPGKPLLFGRLHGLPILGMPGNPVSAMVCAILFLGPALARLQGLAGDAPAQAAACLGSDLKANDARTDHIRATLRHHHDGKPRGLPVATPFQAQDSAMIATLARADALIVREPHASAAKAGEIVSVIALN